MTISLKWIGAGLALVAVAAFVMRHDHSSARQDAAHVHLAAQDQSDARTAAAQADAHARQAQALAAPIQADDQAVSRLAARVDQLAHLQVPPRCHPGPVAAPAPQGGPIPAPKAGPVQGVPHAPTESQAPPAGAPAELEQAKDQLIAAQAKEIADLKAQNAELSLEAGAARQAYQHEEAATGEMGKAIHPNYTRAAGLVYGPGQQAYGVCVDQDISRVRLGVDVLAQQLPATAGGRLQALALVRAAWRF
jgi:hypothetical protein